MRRFLILVAIISLAGMSRPHAQSGCTGSGLVWSCASGSTSVQVQAAIDAASDGAVVTFATGTYNWAVNLNARNGITLICATEGGCTNSNVGDTILHTANVAVTGLMRISGFVFTGAPGQGKIWFYTDKNVSQFRVDHNSFVNLASGVRTIMAGHTASTGRAYGLIDHNTFSGPDNFMGFESFGDFADWPTGSSQGTANNIFVEHNTFNFDAHSNNTRGCVDMTGPMGIVFRYNTVKNCRVVVHSTCHSGGPYNTEVYGNAITDTGTLGYRLIHNQGSGEFLVFDNVLSPAHTWNIELLHYRSENPAGQGDCTTSAYACDGDCAIAPFSGDGNRAGGFGYPCWHQPGRDGSATLRPVYTWNNRVSGTGARISMGLGSDGYFKTDHFLANRDYYLAPSKDAQTSTSSPFDGATGMGFGTVANRPATCTPGPGGLDGTAGGVGYWATDEGEWNSEQAGSDGRLYRCSATNTWTVYYTPYTYPHPLSGTALAPSAPTNVRIR